MELNLGLIGFAFVAAFTPGPNNIMIMTSGLNHGVRSTLPHFFGICFGVPTMLIVVGFWLKFLFERYAWLHVVLQIFGVCYLLYLAWLIANTRSATLDQGGYGKARGKPLSFFQAALFQWVNPKTWMMGTSAIAGFTAVGADAGEQILRVIAVFFFMAFPSAGVWMVFGAFLRRWLSTPVRQRAFNIAMAGILVVTVLPIIRHLLLLAVNA